MKIRHTNGDRHGIAEEFDGGEGYFVAKDDGSIWYRHDSTPSEWYANSSRDNFDRSAEAFNRYTETVLEADSEDAQLQVAYELRNNLLQIENWENSQNSYWKSIAEQTEYGHL